MCEIIDGKTISLTYDCSYMIVHIWSSIWSFIYDHPYMIVHIWSSIYDRSYMIIHIWTIIWVFLFSKIQTHPGGGFHDLNFCVTAKLKCWCPCSCSSHTLADWNTLFHCIFWQIETLCFIVFLTDLNTLFGYIFGRFKHLVSLQFWQIGTPYLVVPFGRLGNLCFVAFLADWNTLFHCIFWQI